MDDPRLASQSSRPWGPQSKGAWRRQSPRLPTSGSKMPKPTLSVQTEPDTALGHEPETWAGDQIEDFPMRNNLFDARVIAT